MTKLVYDPNGVEANVYSADNHVDGTTNKVYTATEKTKLAGVATGAEVNVKANWNEATTTSDAFIQNKPTLGTLAAKSAVDYSTTEITNKPDLSSLHTHSNKTTLDSYDQTNVNLTDAVTKKHSHTNSVALALVSGTNTGDQDLTSYLTSATAASTYEPLKGATDNYLTDTEQTKLAGIAAGAEVNVQSDWNQATTTSDDYIKNKPAAYSLPTAAADTLGGIKVGTRLSIALGVLSADVQTTDISGKLDANTPITGATKTKITYDADGLVTAGADATTADIADSLNKRYVTDAQATVIGNTSGTNSGDNAVNSNYSSLVTNATHTGEVTGSGALTIANSAVTLAKMANLAQSTIIGRVTASTGVPEALSATNVRTIINVADGATANAKATGAEVDTGTDDAKFATAKAIADSKLSYTDGSETLTNKTLTTPVINGEVTGTFGGYNSSLSRQAIINGNFDVSQRATTFVAGANNDDVYTLDRWNLVSNGNDVLDVSQDAVTDLPGSNYAIKLDVETSAQAGIVQFLEAKDAQKFKGKSVSVSFAVKSANIAAIRCAVLSWGSTADTVTSDVVGTWGATPTWAANWTAENTPADLTVTSSWTTVKIENIAVDSATVNNLALAIWLPAAETIGDIVYISQVQMNMGSVALPFQPKSFEEELRACLRYARKISVSAGYTQYNTGIAFSTGSLITSFHITPMRSAPVVTISGNTDFMWQHGGGNGATSALAAYTSNNEFSVVHLDFTTSGMTAYTAVRLISNATSSSWILFSAEL